MTSRKPIPPASLLQRVVFRAIKDSAPEITYSVLEAALGCARGTVQRLMDGEVLPTDAQLVALVEIVGWEAIAHGVAACAGGRFVSEADLAPGAAERHALRLAQGVGAVAGVYADGRVDDHEVATLRDSLSVIRQATAGIEALHFGDPRPVRAVSR